MYNFRYHLVTIVSIFAALVIGLLLGVALTGSDLVRDASSNLAKSLTEEFDELNTENDALTEDLQIENAFSEDLLNVWQKDRLKGRTIVIIERDGETNSTLTTALRDMVSITGGIPVIVSFDAKNGLNVSEEFRKAQLTKIVPEVEGEDYSDTVAKALVNEWTFAVKEPAANLNPVFLNTYKLTNYLAGIRALTVTVDYKLATDTITGLGAEANSPALLQLAAYTQAQRLNLPYSVNGIIDAAYFTSTDGGGASIDRDALNIATAFESVARSKALSTLHFSDSDLVAPYVPSDEELALGMYPQANAGGAEGGEVSGDTTGEAQEDTPPNIPAEANYYSLVVATEENANIAITAAAEHGLTCAFTPFDHIGRYNIIALLSGGTKGNYGTGHLGIEAHVKIPSDTAGDLPFKRG